jgi:hypothetical protein
MGARSGRLIMRKEDGKQEESSLGMGTKLNLKGMTHRDALSPCEVC